MLTQHLTRMDASLAELKESLAEIEELLAKIKENLNKIEERTAVSQPEGPKVSNTTPSL